MICCQKKLWKKSGAKNKAGLPKITFGYFSCVFFSFAAKSLICCWFHHIWRQTTGTPSAGTEAVAADSFVWLAEQDELAAEMVMMLIRLLGGGGGASKGSGWSSEGAAAVCRELQFI